MTDRSIGDAMTPNPISVGQEQPLRVAHELMRENKIRHLTVLHGGRLVGIVSQRDLYLMETFRDVEPEKAKIEEAMSPEVYAVPPETPLREVAAHMAEHKIGTAVVMRGHDVLGVFTTTDAVRELATALAG